MFEDCHIILCSVNVLWPFCIFNRYVGAAFCSYTECMAYHLLVAQISVLLIFFNFVLSVATMLVYVNPFVSILDVSLTALVLQFFLAFVNDFFLFFLNTIFMAVHADVLFISEPRVWLWGVPPIGPVLCQMGRRTVTQSKKADMLLRSYLCGSNSLLFNASGIFFNVFFQFA